MVRQGLIHRRWALVASAAALMAIPVAQAQALAQGATTAPASSSAPSHRAEAAVVDAAKAPPLQLLLQYESRALGHDGVQRDSRHSDRMLRDRDHVWIERVLPQAVRDELGHGHRAAPGPHAGHAHDEAQGAPLLLQRQGQGQGQTLVQVVLQGQRRVIEVDQAHHGNVGYGGSWAAAFWLIDPQALSRMEKLGPPRNGVQRYRLQQGGRSTQVDWDVAGQYVRVLEQKDAHGLSSQRMTAQPQPLPARMPWDTLQGYQRGDYSDLLD